MLEANPWLRPAEVRDILQRTATPLPNYYSHEVGAGMLNAHAATLEAAFPERRMGAWRAALDHGQVRFVTDPFQVFNGSVHPGSAFEPTFNIPQNSLLTSIQIAWGPMLRVNDLGLSVYDSNGVKRGESNYLNLPGLKGKRESVVLKVPSSGMYRARVINSLPAAVSSQPVTCLVETTRVEYATISDLNELAPAEKADVYASLITFSMTSIGRHFRAGNPVSRLDLASSLVLSGRAPQYMFGQRAYTDVRDRNSRNLVESVQNAPGGAFFIDVTLGGNFGPYDRVDRVTAAVVLVRAAGLGGEINSAPALTCLDATSIPLSLRGYVSVALAHGLLKQNGTLFSPQNTFTRLELAHALTVINRLSI